MFIDPFGDVSSLAARGMQFQYQPMAVGTVDLLMLPIGGGPTIGAQQAAAIAERLDPPVDRPVALPHAEDRIPRDG